MSSKIVASNMNLRPGVCMKIVGDIPHDAEQFILELGTDHANIGLHLNPSFNHLKNTDIIICNTKKENVFGKEQKQKHFGFEPGTRVEVSITFEVKQFKVKLPDGFEFTFPNRLNLKAVNYLDISGDFKFKSLSFK